jgi:16S rRNA (guanine527-N7)-methyltransferase
LTGREKVLLRGLEALGFSPDREQMNSFMAYLDELKRWNRAYSLTGLKTDEEVIVKHFLDSCLYLGVLGPEVSRLADVGSGAGFPGIPIKIMRPETEVCLIEPSRKKSAFLRHIIRTLGLEGIVAVEERIEGVRDIEVDAALTRALFRVEDFVRYAAHIVRKHGLFVLSKGPKVREELKGSNLRYDLRVLPLPLSDIKRYFVIIRKA